MGAAAIAVALAASSSRAAPAPKQAPQVTGEVLDREGGAVAGITVIARSARGPRPFETAVVTDRRGHFRLDGLPPGTYWFIALDATHAGSSPALPVFDRLEVVLRLDDEPVRA